MFRRDTIRLVFAKKILYVRLVHLEDTEPFGERTGIFGSKPARLINFFHF